jgi:hypothetical protein
MIDTILVIRQTPQIVRPLLAFPLSPRKLPGAIAATIVVNARERAATNTLVP